MSRPIYLNVPRELVYKGGDVIIRTGANHGGVFLAHRKVLRENSQFFNATLSGAGVWTKPFEVMMDGAMRQVWELEMFFDHDTHLPLLSSRQYEVNTARRIIPENAKANKTFLGQWASAKSMEDFRAVLNAHFDGEYADAYFPPRQFSSTDVQPTKYKVFKYFPEYTQPPQNDDDVAELMPARLEATRYAATYGHFFDAHIRFMPTFCGSRSGHNASRFESFPTHEAARRHLQTMWSIMLRAFYGLTSNQGGRKHLTKNVLLIANTAALADYYGALESIRAVLAQMVLHNQPGIWKLIAEQPRFFLVLGYRLQSMDIYLDAVKHLAGRMAFACTIRPHVYRPNAPSSLALDEYVPDSIINFIEKASREVEAHYLETMDRLNYALNQPPPANEHGPHRRLAQFCIADFLNGHIIGSQWPSGAYDDDEVNRCRTVGPKLIRLLWEVQASRNLGHVDAYLLLSDEAQVFGVSRRALRTAAWSILTSYPVNNLLQEYVNGTKQVSMCKKCKYARVFSGSVYYFDICPKHGHKANYHTGEYDTSLPTWNVTTEMKRHEDTAWIMGPDDFVPNMRDITDSNSTSNTHSRDPAIIGELEKLGIIDNFAVDVDGAAKARKASRYVMLCYVKRQLKPRAKHPKLEVLTRTTDYRTNVTAPPIHSQRKKTRRICAVCSWMTPKLHGLSYS